MQKYFWHGLYRIFKTEPKLFWGLWWCRTHSFTSIRIQVVPQAQSTVTHSEDNELDKQKLNRPKTHYRTNWSTPSQTGSYRSSVVAPCLYRSVDVRPRWIMYTVTDCQELYLHDFKILLLWYSNTVINFSVYMIIHDHATVWIILWVFFLILK